jgi:hypothetical protein
MMPLLAVSAGRYKLPLTVMLPPLKFPLASRLTMVLELFALAAVVLKFAFPLLGETVMSELPVSERTPALLNEVELPSAIVPPPLNRVPAVIVNDELAGIEFATPPFAMSRVPLLVIGPPVKPAPVLTAVTACRLVTAAAVFVSVTLTALPFVAAS